MSATQTSRHEPFANLEAMLSTEAMSALEKRVIIDVASRPWTPPALIAASGSRFLKVETTAADEQGGRYVVKRISPKKDLIMRLSGDRLCRERLVWQHGIIDQLPDEVWAPVLALATDGDGWALLMHDASDSLFINAQYGAPGSVPLDETRSAFIISALAAVHARFWEDPYLLNPALGLCTSRQLYTSLSPAAARREAEGGESLLTWISSGWDLLERLVPADVAVTIRDLLDDPGPLCEALARYPWTLVHGDVRRDHVGLHMVAPPRLVLLDWQFVSVHPPAVNLAWLLSGLHGVVPFSYDVTIDRYRVELAARLGGRFDQTWWQPQLELALLGGLVRGAWFMMHRLTTTGGVVLSGAA